MNIQEQKELATSILNKLEMVSPYAILAGGAPRDWYFNKIAKDFDFYFYSPADTISSVSNQLEKAIGVKVVARGIRDEMVYKHMNCIRRILEVEIEGVMCQFMQLNAPKREFEVLDKMSCSICKVWYKGDRIRLHRDFKLSVASGHVFLSEGYNWNDPHPNKIKNYLKDFKLVAGSSREQATQILISKALSDVG
jgi:hypothetical protein